MTQFDGASTPFWRLFQPEPDTTPYEAEEPEQSIKEENPAGKKVTPRRV